jgi:hypothetical protein
MRAVVWGLVVAHSALSAFLIREMVAFLRRTSSIDDEAALARYQAFVRTQMLGVLAVLALMPVMLLAIISSPADDLVANALPILPFLAWIAASKYLNGLQTRCRTLPTAPALRAAYDEISRIWDNERWPRFPVPQVERDSLRAGSSQISCATHGTTRATTCARCGSFSCASCAASGELGQSRCAACRERYQRVRDALWPLERRVRVSGMVLVGLGIPLVVVALGASSTLVLPARSNLLLWLVAALGGASLLIGMLVTGLGLRSRAAVVLAAIPYLVMAPIGTLGAVYVLAAMLSSQTPHPLSREYGEVVVMTDWRGNKHVYIALAATVLLLPVHIAVLQGAALAALPWLLPAAGG